MNIAVIGNYVLPDYQKFLNKISGVKPDDKVTDLSRHRSGSWDNMKKKRQEDIADSHMVVIGAGWKTSVDAMVDLTYAQKLRKEIYLEVDGQILLYPDCAVSL
jgi:hypothetical protein